MLMKFFGHTWGMQTRIVKLQNITFKPLKLIEKYLINIIRFLLVLLFICVIFKIKFMTTPVIFAFGIGILIFSLLDLVFEFKNVFISIRSFFTVGCTVNFIITVSLLGIYQHLGLNNIMAKEINAIVPSEIIKVLFDSFGFYAMFFIIFGLTWIYFSCLANVKVSITANAIVAGILALIILLADGILILFPQTYLFGFSNEEIEMFKEIGYEPVQMFHILLNIITHPLLIINGIAIIICQLKSYWITKYNHGKDIALIE